MAKPDDIPQDVWDAALEPSEKAYIAFRYDEAQAIVARAMMAAAAKEREACALIADKNAQIDPQEDNVDPSEEFEIGGRVRARAVAAAIRKRGKA
jgi:hypothetical protein